MVNISPLQYNIQHYTCTESLMSKLQLLLNVNVEDKEDNQTRGCRAIFYLRKCCD